MCLRTRLLLFNFVSALVFVQQSIAQTLSIGNATTIKDKQTGIYYASTQINDENPLSFSLCISLDNDVPIDSIIVDGVKCANGDRVEVLANVCKHELVYSDRGEQKVIPFVLTSLPIVTIDKLGSSAQFSIYDPYCRTDSSYFFSSLANVTLRGATASLMDKKSYKVKLLDKDANEENDVNIFGIRISDTWILDGASIDYSRIRNRVCTDIWNKMSSLRDGDMKRNGTQGQFCELMFDGTYQGIYCLTDNINRKLLGLKKLEGKDTDAEVRGILYKCKGNAYGPSKLMKEEIPWTQYNTDVWYDWYLKYPDGIFDERSWQPLYDLIDHTDQLSANLDSVKMLTDCFYYDNFMEYAVFCMSMQLLDNVMHNTYLSVKNRNKSFKVWITPWDMDGSFGRDGASTIFDVHARSFQVFLDTHPYRYYFDEQVQPFYNDFTQLMRLLHEDGAPLSAEVVSQQIDYYTDLLEQSGSWKRECEKWNGMKNVWLDTPINLPESLVEETIFMKNWYKKNEDYFSAVCSVGNVRDTPNNIVHSKSSIYMVNGVRVKTPISQLPHGIYIINGKKIVR